MRRRDLSLWALALAGATALTACGSSSTQSTTTAITPAASTTSPAASGTFNSCSVVSQAQAAGAIGESVTRGVLGTATVEGGLACVFYGPSAPRPRDPNVAQPDSVRVVVVTGADAKRFYDDYKSKVHAQPVAGLGDRAFYDGYASLSVLKGDRYLRVAVTPAGATPSLADEKSLAGEVLPNL